MRVREKPYPAFGDMVRRSAGFLCTIWVVGVVIFSLTMVASIGETRADSFSAVTGKMMSVKVTRGEKGSAIENVSVESGLVNPLRQAPKELKSTGAALRPRLEILNREGTVLYTKEFDYPELITVPMPEPGQPLDGVPPVIPVTNPEVTLVVPYFPDAQSVRIYDSPEKTPSAAIPMSDVQLEAVDGLHISPLSVPSSPGAFNVLIIASGYKAGEMKAFQSRAENVRDKVLSTVPFKTNVSKIKVNLYNNTADLGCYSGCAGIDRLLCCDQDKVIRTAAKSGKYYDEIIVVHNTAQYAGAGYRERNDSYKTNSYSSFCVVYDGPHSGIMSIHEFGHSFGNLCDEYSYGAEPYVYSNCVNCRPSCSDYAANTATCTLSCDAEPTYTRPDDSVMLALTFDNYNGASMKADYAPDGLDKRLHFFVDRPPCLYSISPKESSLSSKGGKVTVSVSANSHGCSAPSVVSNASWITAVLSSFDDNRGKVQVTVLPNESTLERTGTVTIADRTFTVTQAGVVCALGSLVPVNKSFLGAGGTGAFSVTATSPCTWIAEVDAASTSWLTISSGGTGTGAGTVVYSMTPNSTGKRRVGTIRVTLTEYPQKKKTFTVTQAR